MFGPRSVAICCHPLKKKTILAGTQAGSLQEVGLDIYLSFAMA